MTIWVDADACPNPVKEVILTAVRKYKIATIFVANQWLVLPKLAFIKQVTVANNPDAADEYIVQHAQAKDIVITQDIPLAALLVPKQAVVITPHGTLLAAHNIGERLAIRNLHQDIRDQGGHTQGPNAYSAKHKQTFANAFSQQIQKLLRQQ